MVIEQDGEGLLVGPAHLVSSDTIITHKTQPLLEHTPYCVRYMTGGIKAINKCYVLFDCCCSSSNVVQTMMLF